MSEAARYPANVFWSDEDEGFIALAPDLPGCSAFGETKPEALTELEQAIAAWIDAARAAGNPIPQPSRPAAEGQPSGKLLVRMPKSLHAELARGAKRENVSLNHYVVFLLTASVSHSTAQREFSKWIVAATTEGYRSMTVSGNSHAVQTTCLFFSSDPASKMIRHTGDVGMVTASPSVIVGSLRMGRTVHG